MENKGVCSCLKISRYYLCWQVELIELSKFLLHSVRIWFNFCKVSGRQFTFFFSTGGGEWLFPASIFSWSAVPWDSEIQKFSIFPFLHSGRIWFNFCEVWGRQLTFFNTVGGLVIISASIFSRSAIMLAGNGHITKLRFCHIMVTHIWQLLNALSPCYAELRGLKK